MAKKDILVNIWRGVKKPKTPPVMSTSKELDIYKPPADSRSLYNTFFGSKPRTALTLLGGAAAPFVPPMLGSAAGSYFNALKGVYGGGADTQQGITNAQLQSGAYNPMAVYDQIYNENLANIESGRMSPEQLLSVLQSYQPGRTAGGSGRGGQGNIYGGQAAAGIASAAAPTGTSTSGLTPVAGQEALAAQQLRNQGRSLQDYLNTIDRAASAAGVRLDQAGRQQLLNVGLAAYIRDQQQADEQLAAARLARQQAALSSGMMPQFMVTPEIRAQAEQLARGTGVSLQDAVNQLARQYFFNLTQSQG